MTCRSLPLFAALFSFLILDIDEAIEDFIELFASAGVEVFNTRATKLHCSLVALQLEEQPSCNAAWLLFKHMNAAAAFIVFVSSLSLL